MPKGWKALFSITTTSKENTMKIATNILIVVTLTLAIFAGLSVPVISDNCLVCNGVTCPHNSADSLPRMSLIEYSMRNTKSCHLGCLRDWKNIGGAK